MIQAVKKNWMLVTGLVVASALLSFIIAIKYMDEMGAGIEDQEVRPDGAFTYNDYVERAIALEDRADEFRQRLRRCRLINLELDTEAQRMYDKTDDAEERLGKALQREGIDLPRGFNIHTHAISDEDFAKVEEEALAFVRAMEDAVESAVRQVNELGCEME